MNLTSALNLTTPLLIIGAALPHTATSIAAALEQLGYKVFSAKNSRSDSFLPIWEDICRADTTKNATKYREALDQFVFQLSLEGFNATLDAPSCFVYEKLMTYYPEAKVLYTRSDPGSWAKSMVELEYAMDLYYWQPPYNQSWNDGNFCMGYWSKKQLGYRDEEIHPRGVPKNSNPYNDLERKSSLSMASCKVAHLRYQTNVQRRVPPEKLVSYHSSEGWGPLCRHFLPANGNITCPDSEFPLVDVHTKSNDALIRVRREASTRVHLYKVHPALAEQKWLVNVIVFFMKQRRAILSTFSKRFSRRRSPMQKRSYIIERKS